jgi:hypothetical protein
MQREESKEPRRIRTWQATVLTLIVVGLSIVGFATQSGGSDAQPGRASTRSFTDSPLKPACIHTVPLPKRGAVCRDAQPHRARFAGDHSNQSELRRHGPIGIDPRLR